jgi:branched-subunit amino acid ABC-type transport system permease component
VSQIILFALLGLGPGALIASVGLGVVLSYRGSGVINLSMGAMVMLAGYLFWAFRTGYFGISFATAFALPLTLVAMAGVGCVVELVVFRRLRTASPLAKLVASLAVLLLVQAAVLLAFGSTPLNSPAVLPSSSVTVFNVTVPIAQFILAGTVGIIVVVLVGLYRYTRFGLATRAASENERSALLAGLSPSLIALSNTVVGTVLAGLVGILAASVVGLDSTTLPLLIIPALAAALFARFTSFPITYLAGLLIGIAESLVYLASTQSWFPTSQGIALPGLQQVLEFLLIVAALWWRGSSLPQRGEIVEQSLPLVPYQDRLLQRVALPSVACAIALILLPFDFRQALITGLVAMMICLSFVVITGYVGQLSVMQLALAGFAGLLVSHIGDTGGIGFLPAAILGILASVGLGIAVAISALRVRGATLVVVTLAAAEAIQQFIFANGSWGASQTPGSLQQPNLLGLNLGTDAGFRGLDGKLPSPVFGFLALVIVVVLYLLVANLRRGDLGRRMLAVRSNERAAAAAGVHVPRVKIIAFGLGSAIAGIAGVMYTYDFGTFSTSNYDVMIGFALIAGLYVLGISMAQGAVLAGLGATGALIPLVLQKWVLPQNQIATYVQLIAALGLIVQLNLFPEGVLPIMWKRKQDKAQKLERDRGLPAADVSTDALIPEGALRRSNHEASSIVDGAPI